MRMFAFLLPGLVKVFSNEEQSDADKSTQLWLEPLFPIGVLRNVSVIVHIVAYRGAGQIHFAGNPADELWRSFPCKSLQVPPG
ncbi:hypothetical protein [Acidithiobacillus ferriphilus]|uniref:hypothetical protein n=1 Tax=Acidithiobacillus ferriphilus TaxID=1689834 RepID=UPI003FD782D9